MLRAIFFALLAICAAAIPAASPEPEMDPMGAQLYVVPAGRMKYRSMVPSRPISNGMRICPSDYKRGFSILCDIPGKRAVFFVNGSKVRTERSAPFHIKGDFRKTVVPWKSYPERAVIRCKVGRESVEKSVHIGC